MSNLCQWTEISDVETILRLAKVEDLCGKFKDDDDRPRAQQCLAPKEEEEEEFN